MQLSSAWGMQPVILEVVGLPGVPGYPAAIGKKYQKLCPCSFQADHFLSDLSSFYLSIWFSLWVQSHFGPYGRI